MNLENRQGIAVAGTVLVDKINEIAAYPQSGELTKILNLDKSVGGCVPNVAVDLKKISPELDISAIGKIGNDEEGKYVLEVMGQAGVDTSGMVISDMDRTSFTEVMSVINGQRTFFTYPGASADFGYADMKLEQMKSRILHLGYFLLLQKVDEGEGLEILKKATELGLKTSIDLVSENSDRYSIVLPCLPHTDYLIINEHEAGKLTNMEPTDENLEAITRKLMDLGVREKVIIHKPEYALCLSKEGLTMVGSYKLPKGYIKGTTGAGDAFCAGALIGIYHEWSDKEILEFASACAVMALGSADATSGLKTAEEVKSFCEQFDRIQVR
ncbi:MAG: carbohydrate kinase family protein [Lachnospiraceae bacterium]|nr:carbohydrate kinase family protein [Lachnospiraceae bacterium]